MSHSASVPPPVNASLPAADEVVTLDQWLRTRNDADAEQAATKPATDPGGVPEIGGRRKGLDPTRYGDWEKDGRCIDF